jgi:hypothetical protein
MYITYTRRPSAIYKPLSSPVPYQMLIPDPYFYPSRIQDPATKERKKFVVLPFFVTINFTEIKLFYF